MPKGSLTLVSSSVWNVEPVFNSLLVMPSVAGIWRVFAIWQKAIHKGKCHPCGLECAYHAEFLEVADILEKEKQSALNCVEITFPH